MSCHGKDPRPLFSSYKTWPGFYGESDDSLSPQRANEYRSFLKTASTHPRYQHLGFPTGSALTPYRDGANRVGSDYVFRPNLLLTKLLYRGNQARIMRILRTSPQYLRYRYLLLYSVADCSEKEINAQTWAKIWAELGQGERLPFQILKKLGLDVHDYNLAFETHPNWNISEGQGAYTSFLAHSVFMELGASDFLLRNYYDAHVNYYQPIYSIYPFYQKIDALGIALKTTGRVKAGCSLMAQRAVATLGF